jgi:hypothetical protein
MLVAGVVIKMSEDTGRGHERSVRRSRQHTDDVLADLARPVPNDRLSRDSGPSRYLSGRRGSYWCPADRLLHGLVDLFHPTLDAHQLAFAVESLFFCSLSDPSSSVTFGRSTTRASSPAPYMPRNP